MRKLLSLISIYGLEVLFFANIWASVYLLLLGILNSKFPIKPIQDPDIYLREYFFPEPFEIPLYILTSLVLIFFISIFYLHRDFFIKKIENILPPIFFPMKHIAFFLLLILFLNRLGKYPVMEFILFPKEYFYLYIVSVIVIIFILAKISKILIRKRLRWLLFLTTILVIAFFTFEPGFPIAREDYSLFIGPIYEISHGKTIYTDIPSLYGFLSIVFFGFLSKIVGVMYLPVVVWLLYILEYFLSFYLFYKFSKSFTFSLLGLFSIITINHFSLLHLANVIPQLIFRWPQLILATFLFYFFKNVLSKRLIFSVALLSYLAIDAGIALIIAYLFTLLLFFFKKTIELKQILVGFLQLIINLIIIFIAINIFHMIAGYKPIDFLTVFDKVSASGVSGLYMRPIEQISFFWIIILIYVISLIFFLKKKSYSQEEQVLMFIANISLFVGTYYIGKSVEHAILYISIFPITNIFLLISFLIKNTQKKQLKIFLMSIFTIFILIPAYLRSGYLPNIVEWTLQRWEVKELFKPEIDEYLKKEYSEEESLIKKNLSQKEIIILSPDDTYFFYFLKKNNLLYANPTHVLYDKAEVDKAVSSIKICPNKIVISCHMYKENNDCKENLVYTHWTYTILGELLNRLEKVCNAKYLKTECTQRLCIAEIK